MSVVRYHEATLSYGNGAWMALAELNHRVANDLPAPTVLLSSRATTNTFIASM